VTFSAGYRVSQKFDIFPLGPDDMRIVLWVPLLARPAVLFALALLDEPAVAPAGQSVITFENCYSIVPFQRMTAMGEFLDHPGLHLNSAT
jgi:hypothetical protein